MTVRMIRFTIDHEDEEPYSGAGSGRSSGSAPRVELPPTSRHLSSALVPPTDFYSPDHGDYESARRYNDVSAKVNSVLGQLEGPDHQVGDRGFLSPVIRPMEALSGLNPHAPAIVVIPGQHGKRT